MKYAFAFDHREEFDIADMARVSEFSRSGNYDWASRPTSERLGREMAIKRDIEKIFMGSRQTYGSPRVHHELVGFGHDVGEDTVARYMRDMGLKARQTKKHKVRTTDSNHQHPIAKNIIDRDFTASRPNEKWLSDITYIRTGEGWLYLTGILDLFSRKIVGWSFSESLAHQGVLDALAMACQNRSPQEQLIFHSDRGVQYACAEFREEMKKLKFIQSMSRKGDCWDNAPMESFFHTLKTELVYHAEFRTRAEARAAIFEWIECFYNRVRIHSANDYKSPLAMEEGLMLAEAA
jgi:transposase InsO family protein